jgi:cation diffusion facilitator CzcD-associated flavoprotein CzcO
MNNNQTPGDPELPKYDAIIIGAGMGGLVCGNSWKNTLFPGAIARISRGKVTHSMLPSIFLTVASPAGWFSRF